MTALALSVYAFILILALLAAAVIGLSLLAAIIVGIILIVKNKKNNQDNG